ncbi:MAG: AAA family ATPase [Gemmataceae bacterium]|nr:AAA family ATPase [Gemmataceae bacterium]
MAQESTIPAYLPELFPWASARLLGLCAAASQNGGLLLSHFHTLRDWLSIAEYEQEELVALLMLLFLAHEEGSLCLEMDPGRMRQRFRGFTEEVDAAWWTDAIGRKLAANQFSALIGAVPLDHRPVILFRRHERTFLYFQKLLRHEIEFAKCLLSFHRDPKVGAAGIPRADVVREVLDEQPLQPGGQPLVLDSAQKLALGLALCRNLVLISGGPGTGKTSIVVNILRCLVRAGLRPENIALAAPTGRAAQRLADTIRGGLETLGPLPAESPDALLQTLSAQTLHKLLDYQPSRDLYRRHAENPISADVVIVDEVSMAGLLLLSKLVQALRPHTKLILLGDKDQLPSVDAGAVLAALIPDDAAGTLSPELKSQLQNLIGSIDAGAGGHPHGLPDAVAILRTNHRSQPHIKETAAAINAQDITVVERLPRFAPATDFVNTSLTRERRSVNEPSLARRAGVNTSPPREQGQGCWLWEQKSRTPLEVRRMVHAWTEHAYIQSGLVEQVARFRLPAGNSLEPAQEKELRELLRLVEYQRMLTLVREGPWGCVDINRQIERLLRPKLLAHLANTSPTREQSNTSPTRVQANTSPTRERGFDNKGQNRNPALPSSLAGRREGEYRGLLFPGAVVLVTQNDAHREIYNGDVGLALQTEDGGLRVAFSRQSDIVLLPADALPAHELGFAMTVHKSQGSEYAEVLLVLPPADRSLKAAATKGITTGPVAAGFSLRSPTGMRLLTKELIYTGITRAKQRAIICAAPDVLKLAISSKCQRESGILGFWDSPFDFQDGEP